MEDLKGKTVRIDHFLTTDPYNKRGQKGLVIKHEEDVLTIEFDDGTVGKYQDDTVEIIEATQ